MRYFIGINDSNGAFKKSDTLFFYDTEGRTLKTFDSDYLILCVDPKRDSKEVGLFGQILRYFGINRPEWFVGYNEPDKQKRVSMNERLKNTLRVIAENILKAKVDTDCYSFGSYVASQDEEAQKRMFKIYDFTEFPNEYVRYINAVLNYPSRDKEVGKLKADVEIAIISQASRREIPEENRGKVLRKYGMDPDRHSAQTTQITSQQTGTKGPSNPVKIDEEKPKSKKSENEGNSLS